MLYLVGTIKNQENWKNTRGKRGQLVSKILPQEYQEIFIFRITDLLKNATIPEVETSLRYRDIMVPCILVLPGSTGHTPHKQGEYCSLPQTWQI